ncbi:glycosyltransferase family 4 protein [Sulfitobacter mediterraneus]|uniref:Glycosyltransferase involved in cell wall biosynthesis n=1 Tax=Sulfitobacter mediterraneus TaxID=83219 RepID=A0A2T6CDS7_9RHOB|nr:glycosyltransferase family 4 protein [Sulfitobacter mediterraneus]KIN75996.1 Glycosyltransferase, group 1 [Sulfitobacter mediterraneus KCTC 32188]PTX73672.1 glycosyltransferase involved in cell wall biosynthesis [Sulfitobacter mediterraneus]
MRLAFYAPMKPPDDPLPSGDRSIARGLVAALDHLGAEVTLASRFRSRDGRGNTEVQADLMAQATSEITRAVAQGKTAGWQAWLTYHNYYKAPDLIGPHVAAALGIPYLQIESTRARKRLDGPWAAFAKAAEAASDAAQVIFYFTKHDAETLHRDAPQSQVLIHLPPFLNRDTLPAASDLTGPMLSVGMMRSAAKLPSYRIIAETLAMLPDTGWSLQIAGDGPARAEVDALMVPFGDKVRCLGALDEAALREVYRTSSLLFWPGIDEAFGMVYLEAQAAGLPVIAQDRPGVREVLAGVSYPAVQDGPAALAARITDLMNNPAKRHKAASEARNMITQHHLLPAAAQVLRRGLAEAGVQ